MGRRTEHFLRELVGLRSCQKRRAGLGLTTLRDDPEAEDWLDRAVQREPGRPSKSETVDNVNSI